MTRTILAATALIVLGFTGTGAQACISCEYVPEVVRAHSTLEAPREHRKSYGAYAVRKNRSTKRQAAKRPEKPAKIVKARHFDKPAKVATVEKRSPRTKVETSVGKTAKVAAKAIDSQASTITAAVAEIADVVTGAVQQKTKPTDCKKFFPTVGMTLTVPCE